MRTLFIIPILLGILLAGCAVHRATLNQFVDPTYTSGYISSVAIFPPRNTQIAASEAQVLNRRFSQAIHAKNPNVIIMSAAAAQRLLSENNLVSEWSYFLDTYTTSGIPDGNSLARIGAALNVDCIIQGEIVNISQIDGVYGGSKGTTRVTVRYSMLDTRSGKLVWEASSNGVRGTATTVESAPPIIEAINLAVDKILTALPDM